jgi:ribonuclease D
MSEGLLVDQTDFDDFCDHVLADGIVAFDTEFVSEYTHRPELCLLQFATREQCVAVDPFEVRNLDRWWAIMADPAVNVVVHGGQAEIRFCLELGNQTPQNIADIQLAEALRSRSYPLGYATLVRRVLGARVHGKETRTDWRRRPLTSHQIHYALEDVKHVLPIWDKQRRWLKDHGRRDWADTEFQRMIGELEEECLRPGWHRLSGLHRLSLRELAVAQEISNWRDAEALKRNRPLRKILRDDIIIELAHRQPTTEKELLAMRDMNRSDYRRSSVDLLKAIERALAVPDKDLAPLPLPYPPNGGDSRDEQVLGQLLGIALANRCAEMNVAKPLVATSADLRHLVRWHVFQERIGPAPRLIEGWRAEVCGDLLADVLDGRVTLRVSDPTSDHPLIFEPFTEPNRSGG